MRQLQVHLSDLRVVKIVAGVALILGLSGPFDTWATQELPERMVYWGLVVCLTYIAGFIVTTKVTPFVAEQNLAVRSAGIAFAVALAVFALLLVLNALFDQLPETALGYVFAFGAVLVICLVIEATRQVLGQTPRAVLHENGPALLTRLPLAQRGALVSLSVQDHYVDVITTKGHALLLLRLGDAIRETAPEKGLQVHRSHWVAEAQIKGVTPKGNGAVLQMQHGPDIPVSRTYMAAVREAGILPRKGT